MTIPGAFGITGAIFLTIAFIFFLVFVEEEELKETVRQKCIWIASINGVISLLCFLAAIWTEVLL